MTIQIILFILFGTIISWIFLKPLLIKKNSKNDLKEPSLPEIPVEDSPIEVIEPEMPEKPLPVNCQLAQFQPAPQDFFYVDCCGVPQKGQGFEPWEKRSPVSIDSNKPFFGMTLLDVEAEINC